MGLTDLPMVAMPPTRVTCLEHILYRAAESSSGITIYDDLEEVSSKQVSYHELLRTALKQAKKLKTLANARRGKVVFLHLQSFQQNVEWFWATVLAGLLPAVSTKLPTNADQARIHLTHVHNMLNDPIILTTKDSAGDFRCIKDIDRHSVEDLELFKSVNADEHTDFVRGNMCSTDPAALMLTSGSSGNAKAAVLRHEQMIASVQGKSEFFNTTNSDVFLNWIGFDHVASLMETHIHAMYLNAELIHVPASALVENPVRFLWLVDKHRVSYTFAPHFFLARLLQRLENPDTRRTKFELSSLRHLISGGESNLVETIIGLTKVLQDHQLSGEVIRPGFGMTETCAGSIYSRNCPSYDVKKGNVFASLGQSISGLQMRIVDFAGNEAPVGDTGDLQVAGKVVFREYFNSTKANMASFTSDGWFVTGDRANIDGDGNLNIAGREQDSINLNGIKFFPVEIETALENANIPGLTPSYTMVFSHRPPNSHEEEICVLYHPTFGLQKIASRVDTASRITVVVGTITTARPKHIVPLPKMLLDKSTLGKLQRAKIRAAFETGTYEQYEDSTDPNVKRFIAAQREDPATATENKILVALRDIVNAAEENLGMNNSIFDFGVSSTDLFTLKRRIEKDLNLSAPVPVGILLTTPTIRGIASELDCLGQKGEEQGYNPVVPLQSNPTSSKPPLWLVHPGSGDVLVFVALAKYFPDRTVYGLRTRGLNTSTGETPNYFPTIHAIASCYTAAITQHQPHGPYALAGYSLGSTVAFEIAKRLEACGAAVPFLGLFDSPPHMRPLIEKLDWTDVLINVAYFLELLRDEDDAARVSTELRRRPTATTANPTTNSSCSSDHALDLILSLAPRARLDALAIDRPRLRTLTDVTHAFGVAGKEYEPDGTVGGADVFWVTPLRSVAASRQEWMEGHLARWRGFCREEPRWHECAGEHSKMLNGEFVGAFQVRLKAAMAKRGI